MNKEEIIRFIYINQNLPQEVIQNSNNTSFLIELLEMDPNIFRYYPINLQKKILLVDKKYLEYTRGTAKKIFEDEKFAKEIIDKDNDVLLYLRDRSIKNDYITNLMIAYIKKEKKPERGTEISCLEDIFLYDYATLEVKQNYDVAKYLVELDIGNLRHIVNDQIFNEYIIEYITKNPYAFSKYIDEISNRLTPELIEAVLKYDFRNYTLIDRNNPLMKQFYESIDRIKKVRPEVSMDNPNLRYELLCDSEFINMDINIINSLLEYSTGNVDKVIDIKNNGNLQYLLNYIEHYKGLYGNTLENIQNAISSYENVEELILNTNGLKDLDLDEPKLKTIIVTGNKFNITNSEEVLNYDIIVREYYSNNIQNATTAEEIKEIYAEMLFNSSSENINKFYEEYCNCNIDELQEYAIKHSIEMPISEEFKKRKILFDQIKNIDSIVELKSYFDKMPLEITDLEETKQAISAMYSAGYNAEMFDLNDETLERTTLEGVEVIKLNGQSFNICIHRIYNFDFNMNSITKRILSNPEQWVLLEGSNTVSTTFISDKKIAVVFEHLRTSEYTEFIHLNPDEVEEYEKKVIENIIQLYEGQTLKEIDQDAVFYGFTELLSNGIIKMDSTDMMIEHGKGHLQANSNNCKMRNSEDLAYWTNPGYWNEVAQKRKETDIDKANQLREANGTDRMLPSCIVCFDVKINDQSLLAARTHNIPILMIDRQQYLDINVQKLNEAKQNFQTTLLPESIKEIFYRQPYYKIVEDIPGLIDIIKNNQTVSPDDKKISLEYLGYLVQHFIEQSSGYIINTPVEEYNKQMQKHLQNIDLELQGATEQLVSMSDMENAYMETSAINRKRRYEALRKDIQNANSKESEIVYE